MERTFINEISFFGSKNSYGGLINTLFVWRRRARDRRHLAQLNRHLLNDIGVDPVTANQEAAKPFWRA